MRVLHVGALVLGAILGWLVGPLLMRSPLARG